MLKTWVASSIVAVGVVSGAGCSLAGFDNFRLPACTSDNECDSLNRRSGTAFDACNRYVCNREVSECQRKSQQAEVCDGVDNDCDGFIDENVLGLSMSASIASGNFGAVGFTSSNGGMAAIGAVVASGPATFVSVAADGMSTTERMVSPRTAFFLGGRTMGNNSVNWLGWEGTDLGMCSSARNTAAIACRTNEAALAPGRNGDEWFMLAVDGLNCGSGRLRAGILAPSASPPLFDVRGPLAVSNVVDGIDIADGPMQDLCTGRSRAGSSRGAARPVIAQGRPVNYDGMLAATALGAWLGAPQNGRTACGAVAPAPEEVFVEALGFSTVNFRAGVSTTLRPLVATNAPMGTPVPVALGSTRGGGAPAVLALPTGGWLVGFGNATGDVTLRTVAPFAPTMPIDGMAPYNVPRTSEPLVLGAPFTIGRGGAAGRADHVALALRTVPERAAPLIAVTWVEGCGAANTEVYLAQLEMNNGTFTERNRTLVAGPLTGGAGATLTSVLGLNGGLIDRGHPQYASGDLGGWLVTYVASGGLRGVRVLGANVSLIDSPAALLVESGVTLYSQPPHLYATDRTPALVAWYDQPNLTVKTAALCGAPPPTR